MAPWGPWPGNLAGGGGGGIGTGATVFVNTATGNDNGDGSAGNPWLTMQRVEQAFFDVFLTDPTKPIVVFLTGDMAANDGASFASVQSLAGFPTDVPNSPSGFDSWITLIGVPTVSYSGTITAPPTNIVAPTNVRTSMQDTNIPGGSFTASGFMATGFLYKRTTAPVCYWWPAKDLGATSLQFSQPNATTDVYPNLANADAYQILRLPRIHNLAFGAGQVLEPSAQIALCHVDSPALSWRGNDAITWYGCSFANLQFMGTGQFFNCRIPSANWGFKSLVDSGAGGQMISGLLTGPGTTFIRGFWLFSDEAGGYITAMNTRLFGDVQGNASRALVQTYDNVGRDIIEVNQMSTFDVIAVGGTGNNQKIFNVLNSGALITYGTLPAAATLTTDANPYSVRGVAGAAPTVDPTHLCGICAE